MDKQLVSKFTFNDYNVENIDFTLNNDYSAKDSIDLDVRFQVEIKLAENNIKEAKVILTAFIFEECKANDYPFSLTLDIAGYFTYDRDSEATEEDVINVCKLNGTTALFPYLRSSISDITRVANVQPLILPLVNIYKLLEFQEN
jgi:preprotein translocase subunit SecB